MTAAAPDNIFRDARGRAARYEAEQALLAALLDNPKAWEDVADALRPEHFADDRNGLIYEAIDKLRRADKPADPATLSDHFKATGGLDSIGGTAYLAKLAANVVTTLFARDYANQLIDAWKRRRLIDVAESLVEGVGSDDLERTADHFIGSAQAGLDRLIDGDPQGGMQSIGTATGAALGQIEEAYKAGTGIVGVPTGIAELDRDLGGLRRQNMIILGGRPGMGKSTLAANIARNAARAGHTVAWFSLEMSAEECARVLMAIESGISASDMARGKVPQAEWTKLLDAQEGHAGLPIHIDDTPGLSVAQIQVRARRVKPALTIIDHLGLIPRAEPDSRPRSKYERVSEVSNATKVLAKRLDCPVLTLAQLSRANEHREDKRPTMADLRDSGDIEQDADVVAFLHRDEYYLARRPAETRDAAWHQIMDDVRGTADVIIAKNRMGPQAVRRIAFDAPTSRFASLQKEDHDKTEEFGF